MEYSEDIAEIKTIEDWNNPDYVSVKDYCEEKKLSLYHKDDIFCECPLNNNFIVDVILKCIFRTDELDERDYLFDPDEIKYGPYKKVEHKYLLHLVGA